MSFITRFATNSPITVFQGSHKVSSGTLQVQTPRMYGNVYITVVQSGPDNLAGLLQPKIFDHAGNRITTTIGDWQTTPAGAKTAYRYITMVKDSLLALPSGCYVEGIEAYSWETGANTITKITVQN